MFAILYSLFIFTPAVIWLNLNTIGVNLSSVVPLITLLIFTEIAVLYHNPLTIQECAVILGPATAAGSAIFLNLIFKAYYTTNPLLGLFQINPLEIPPWWGPPSTSQVYLLRTFFHPDYLLPILISSFTWISGSTGALFMAFIGREIFIENENLPFPMQQIQATTVTVLAERNEDRMTVFAWVGIISFIYGLILYTIPTYTNVAKIPIRVLPIPWIDLTQDIELYIPGGGFGIATDLIVLSMGLVIPKFVVIGLFLGSFVRFLVVNPLLVSFGISGWATRWTPGMDFTRIFQDSTLFYWLNPIIGTGLAIAIVPLVLQGKNFGRALKRAFNIGKSSDSKERISGPPLKTIWMLLLFIPGMLGPLLVDIYLVPDFPVFPLILYELVFPFFFLLASGRMVATTGVGFDFPYLNEITILSGGAFGYTKLEAWFLPLTPNPGWAWLQSLKLAQLTKTSYRSWIATNLISYPIALISGLLYMQLFWQIAPIPSDIYPAPGIMWPINLFHKSTWITRPVGIFDLPTIGFWGIGTGVLVAITHFIGGITSIVGAVAGFSLPLPVAFTQLLGMLIGLLISKQKGKDWLNNYKTTIAAGMGLGEGLAIVLGVIFALAYNAIWGGQVV
jgi:hypothetical protein